MHADQCAATPDRREKMDAEIYRHRLSIFNRQLCNSKYQAYIALYNGQPAALSLWSVVLGTKNRHLLSHRLRPRPIHEVFWSVWYKLVDYITFYIPDSLQTLIWYPNLGPNYLARAKLQQQQREGTAKKRMSEDDKEQGYRILVMLSTLPEYERKGIGSKLLKPGLEEARNDGVSVYLGATPAGKPLYDRNGFKVVGVEKKGEPGVCEWDEIVMKWRDVGEETEAV